ncbi:MAG TPA: hypothetical protein VMI56_07500 [Reyranella sp.]|nr:hypothetical protein [Reyranella sp.]
MRSPRFLFLAILFFSSTALAAESIEVKRGEDLMVFGNCVPRMLVENKTNDTVGYLQIDLELTLVDGRKKIVELKSAYRGGIDRPIAPKGHLILQQHLDESTALGAPCKDVTARKVARVLCEAAGRSCAYFVKVDP